MPPKLYLNHQSFRNDRLSNSKLPAIQLPNQDKNKQTINNNAPHQLNSQNRQNNETTLLYSNSNKSKVTIPIPARTRRLLTQQPVNEYHKLSKIQKKIMMQIKDIDICLSSKRDQRQQKNNLKTCLFNGYIFLNEANQFVIEKFHECLLIQAEGSYSLTDGFDVAHHVAELNGEVSVVEAKIVKNLPTMSSKLLNSSINTIKQYDEQKKHEHIKNYGKQWSLYKRELPDLSINQQQQLQKQLINKNYSLKSCNTNSLLNSMVKNNQSKLTFINQFSRYEKNNESLSTNLCESKFTSSSAHTRNNALSKLYLFGKNNQTRKFSTVKTEADDNQRQNQQVVAKLTKRDLKNMLRKHKNIVTVWIPPASYPQFFGIFVYKLAKLQDPNKLSNSFIYKCKINKYFFNKFGLSKKVFDAILEYITFQNNMQIDSLEIKLQKLIFNKIFSKMGWVLKSWESSSRVRAVYSKIENC